MGWFYGFKLHLMINDEGEILSFCLTSGNIDDRNEAVMDSLTKEIFGKLFADRGYISQKLFEKLLKKDITLVTRAKKNRKNKLMDFYDRLMLRKRAVIESVNDFLKNICDIEHSRHRSVTNFLVNLVSALAAYSFLPKKPFVCSASNIPKGFLCILD
ncbi:MAG: IS982 family transposase [Ruminococcus sp.]|nr:IS982 family transposase [Ruminococcus sp.]